MNTAMASLSSQDRELLQLVGGEQLDQRSAAQALGCSVGALKVRLHRARRRLSAAMADSDPGPDPSQSAAVVPMHRPCAAPEIENLR